MLRPCVFVSRDPNGRKEVAVKPMPTQVAEDDWWVPSLTIDPVPLSQHKDPASPSEGELEEVLLHHSWQSNFGQLPVRFEECVVRAQIARTASLKTGGRDVSLTKYKRQMTSLQGGHQVLVSAERTGYVSRRVSTG